MNRDHDAIMHRSLAGEKSDAECFGCFFRESPLSEIRMSGIDVLQLERKWFVRFTLPSPIFIFRNTLRLRFLARGNFSVRFLANQFVIPSRSRNEKPGLQ